MKKSDYRKFIIRGEPCRRAGKVESGILRDDFASMREAVERRYRRVQRREQAAAQPDPHRRRNRPIARRGPGARKTGNHQSAHGQHREKGRNSLRSGTRGRAHRPRPPFAGAAFDPADSRRDAPLRRDFSSPAPLQPPLRTSLTEIPGVGERTAQKLLRRFGSVARLRQLTLDELTAEFPPATGLQRYLRRPSRIGNSARLRQSPMCRFAEARDAALRRRPRSATERTCALEKSLLRLGDEVRSKVVEAEAVDKPLVRVARDFGSEAEAEKRDLRRLARSGIVSQSN